MLGPNDILIDDSTDSDAVGGLSHGLIPRDYSKYPVGYCHKTFEAVDVPLIARSEWSARIKEKEQNKSRISDYLAECDYGSPIKTYYQDGYGYCWAYSTGHALTACRAVMRLPFVALSPFAVAYLIKNGRNEGGWGALSTQWAQDNGYPSLAAAPNLKAVQDSATLRADMAKYKATEAFVDLADPVYSRNLTFDQMASCLLVNIPVVVDFNWWGHSVCAVDLVEVEPGSFAPRIVNSHGEVLSQQLMVLQGNRGIPDGAVAIRQALAG